MLAPHMTDAESSLYRQLLTEVECVVEYGAGGSTFMALDSAARKIISIESDRRWVRQLRRNWRVLFAEIRGRLSLRYIDIGPVRKKWSSPKDESCRHLWPAYAKGPWPCSPDLVLIDGRFRVACIAQAALNAPQATIVVHDFWTRPHYHATLDILSECGRADTLGVFKAKACSADLATRLFEQFSYDYR
jgi:hypothetical protein